MLHRDISGGNLLILPQIIELQGRRYVSWKGLLCDWEMAKPVVSARTSRGLDRPRQPERTVRLLTHWIKSAL